MLPCRHDSIERQPSPAVSCGGMPMARGIARNTTEARSWLEGCPQVNTIIESGEMLDFRWEGQEPPEVPEGIYFDLAAAPF